jgi:hypothetical protein
MKTLRWIAWASAGLAAIIIILGCIALLSGMSIFGIVHAINFFHVANSLLLIAIALFIGTKQCCCCDECECKDEKKEAGK